MADEQTQAVAIDYDAMTSEQVLAEMEKAFKSKDMKLVGQLSKLYAKKEQEAEKAARDAMLAKLAETTETVRTTIEKALTELIESGELDGADGVWFAKDFGEQLSTCRLTKTATRKVAEAGAGAGKGSYVANPAKSADLLAQVGDRIYLAEATTVTIDKVEHALPAGTTFKQAYDFSQNGGWRNRVRMALLKEAGVI